MHQHIPQPQLRSSHPLKTMSFMWISFFACSLRTLHQVSPKITPVTAPCLWMRPRSPAPASTTVTSTKETTPAHTTVSTLCWHGPTAGGAPSPRLLSVHTRTLRGGWWGRDTCTAQRGGWSRSTLPAVRITTKLIICDRREVGAMHKLSGN